MSVNASTTRRTFLHRLGCTLLGGGTASLLPQLALMPKAAAQSSGYRALVCVYLAGANDSFNWLVPRDGEASGSHYDRYRTCRGGVYSGSNTAGLALAYGDLLPLDAVPYGLHPSCADFTLGSGGTTQATPGLRSLFNQGKAAFIANVGPLIRPIRKSEYEQGLGVPAQLFSHNDQERLWHLGVADKALPEARYGWGGRLAKAVTAGSASIGLSPNISLAGAAQFLVGDQLLPYQMSSAGVNLIDNYATSGDTLNYGAARRAVLEQILADGGAHPFAQEYNKVFKRALDVGEVLASRLNGAEGSVATLFPANNALADQLRMVARMIKVSRGLGATRQVYYVRYGSFDLHQNMFVSGGALTSSGHGALLTAVNQALGAFWTALGEIGAREQVTTFTMSEFGRTLTSNGSGSDHAWGGHMLVLGEHVLGRQIYGKYPAMVLNANDDANQDWSFNRGQYIPTTAIEQVAASLARWMGVPESGLDALFPLLRNFSPRDLGFMR